MRVCVPLKLNARCSILCSVLRASAVVDDNDCIYFICHDERKKNTHISHVESHEMHENRKSHRVFKMVTKNNQPNVQLNPFSYVGFFFVVCCCFECSPQCSSFSEKIGMNVTCARDIMQHIVSHHSQTQAQTKKPRFWLYQNAHGFLNTLYRWVSFIHSIFFSLDFSLRLLLDRSFTRFFFFFF